jgi:hypothetical protein
VDPPALKEAVTHHTLTQKKKDGRQNEYKQELSSSKRGSLPSWRSRIHRIKPPSQRRPTFRPVVWESDLCIKILENIAVLFRVRKMWLKIPETVSLRLKQRGFAGQYFSKSPVNAAYSFGDHSDELPVVIHLCCKPHGGHCVPDMMIHLCNHLHSCLNKPMSIVGEVGQLCDQAAHDES